MRNYFQVSSVWTIGCMMGLVLTSHALAVSDEDFNTLKDQVSKQGGRIDQVEKTQAVATNTAAKSEVSVVQPVYPASALGSSASHNFMMVGDAEVQFGKVEGQSSGFTFADFAPIFLYRASDSVLFEAGFDIGLQNGSTTLLNGQTHDSSSQTTIDLSFAQLDYLLNDYATIVAGYMLLPLGTYTERGAGWLNKIPDDPLPRALLQDSGIGVQIRGSIPLDDSGQVFTYAVYGVNGPSSVDGSGNSTTLDAGSNSIPNLDLGGNVGIKSDSTTANLHSSPSGGGRLGWFLPWKAHYDLELGVSGQSGAWDDAGKRLWSAGVLDAALHLSPYFEAKGECINTWQETDDIGTIRPRGFWIQASYKLAALDMDLPIVNDVELVSRYDRTDDDMGTRTHRCTMGYVYYLSNTLLFEGDYESIGSDDPSQAHNDFVLQFSYGF